MIAPARLISYQILLQIATSDAHSDELLRSAEVDALSAQDRNLTTTLVLGTLRWQLALDARIRGLLARPGAKLSAEAATALRMGAYQLGYLERVPTHAVIHDSVELVKTAPARKRTGGSETAMVSRARGGDPGAAGMVNAVLRKIAAQGKVENAGPSAPRLRRSAQDDTLVMRELAARWAHPEWMVERWARRYGLEAAEAICRWDQEPAGICLRLVEPGADLEGIETEPGAFLRAARRLIRGDVGRSAAFREGRIRIQDEASQLVAEVLAGRAGPGRTGGEKNRTTAPNEARQETGGGALRVLDTCAAPGGKTAILAERLPEAEITAVDVSRKRLDIMRKRMPGSIAERVRFEVADAVRLQLKPEWDLILCDVPCSGTGTMARNPEIRLRVTEADLGRQQARQVAILRAGLAGLAPGGRLVYSTCSLELEENEQVVEEVLREASGFGVVPVEGILDRLAESGVVTADGRERLRTATEGGFLRTLPGVHPCDGFFAAVLARD
jgi:16S rRNA (cytosine967-C5)-methyltransferase